MSVKKIGGIFCGCAFLIWSAACIEVTSPDYFDDNGDTLVLKFGETKIGQSSGVRLTFSEILEDSRCPGNVRCCWEGIARIQVGVRNSLQESVLVNLPIYGYLTAGDSMRHVTVDTLGYSLKLLQLDPYPEETVEPEISTYQATISIERYKEK